MTRTTLDLDTTILEELRRRAGAEGKSMGQVASEVLALGLHEGPATELPPLQWARKDLGLKVDLEDKDALWRMLDAEDYEDGSG